MENERRAREGRFWEQFTRLLTLIGLWLALPATCNLVQRLVDNLAGLQLFSDVVLAIIKIAVDGCLLSFYVVGLFFLMLLGSSTIVAAQAFTATGKFVQDAKRERGIRGFFLWVFSWFSLKVWGKWFGEIWYGDDGYLQKQEVDKTKMLSDEQE